MFVEAGGERSFVTDRGAALRLRPEDLRAAWFAGAEVVHLPAYSLLDQPLGRAGMVAIRLARAGGRARHAWTSRPVGPLLARGPPRGAGPDPRGRAGPAVRHAGRGEGAAWVPRREDGLLELAPIAVVKRGRKGATDPRSRDGRSGLPLRGRHHPDQGRGHDRRRRRVQRRLPGTPGSRRAGAAYRSRRRSQRGAVAGNRTRLPPPVARRRPSSASAEPRWSPPEPPFGLRPSAPGGAAARPPRYGRRKRSNQSSIRVIRSMRRSMRPVAWITWYSSG